MPSIAPPDAFDRLRLPCGKKRRPRLFSRPKKFFLFVLGTKLSKIQSRKNCPPVQKQHLPCPRLCAEAQKTLGPPAHSRAARLTAFQTARISACFFSKKTFGDAPRFTARVTGTRWILKIPSEVPEVCFRLEELVFTLHRPFPSGPTLPWRASKLADHHPPSTNNFTEKLRRCGESFRSSRGAGQSQSCSFRRSSHVCCWARGRPSTHFGGSRLFTEVLGCRTD